jgi:hypothetical protein
MIAVVGVISGWNTSSRGGGGIRSRKIVHQLWLSLLLAVCWSGVLLPQTRAMRLLIGQNEATATSRLVLSPQNISITIPIRLSLTADEARDTGTVDINQCHMCVLINGDLCHCYNEKLADLEFRVPPQCIINRGGKNSWLSIRLNRCTPTLHDNRVSLHSTAVELIYDDTDSNAQTPAANTQQLLSLVLPLTVNDIARALLLFQSLHQTTAMSRLNNCTHHPLIKEMFVIVPDTQATFISRALLSYTLNNLGCERHDLVLPFPVHVMKESILLSTADDKIAQYHAKFSSRTLINSDRKKPYTYALQMALKLLIARHISTPYYLTLDADIISLLPLTFSRLFRYSAEQSSSNVKKQLGDDIRARDEYDKDGLSVESSGVVAIYENEPRNVHMNWWIGSARFLFSHLHEGYLENVIMDNHKGFGVTPAVLSTFGSLMTLSAIHSAVGHSLYEEHAACMSVNDDNISSDQDCSITSRSTYEEWIVRTNFSHEELEYFWLMHFARDQDSLWSEVNGNRVCVNYDELSANNFRPCCSTPCIG